MTNQHIKTAEALKSTPAPQVLTRDQLKSVAGGRVGGVVRTKPTGNNSVGNS